MKKLFALCLLLLFPSIAHAAYPADAIPDDFILSYDGPIRAYPGVTSTWRLSYYEKDNRLLTWGMTGAPSGMTISQDGTVTYVNPVGGVYSGIQITATRAACDTTNYPSCVLTKTRTFNLVVGNMDFIFVSTSGSDTTGNGSMASPYRTILKGLQQITTDDGKTIYILGGAYNERWNWDATAAGYVGPSPGAFIGGKDYTEEDYLEIRAYPGDSVIFTSTGTYPTSLGHGFYIEDAHHIVVSNIEIVGSTMRSNYESRGDFNIFKDSITHGVNYSGDYNPAGVRIISGEENIVNRVVSYGNKWVSGGTEGNTDNMANFMVMHEATDPGEITYFWNIKGWDTTHNFLLKHATAVGTPTVIHNAEFIGAGFSGMENDSSIRYSVFWNTEPRIGKTDPNEVDKGFLFEHNTVVSPNRTMYVQDIYYAIASPGLKIRHNIFYLTGGACAASGQNAPGFMRMWVNTDPLAVPRAYPFDSDYNTYYNPAGDTDCWSMGSDGATTPTLDFTAWKALTGAGVVRDPNSILTNPAFVNFATGDLKILSSSPAATGCGSGEYCGAFRPDQTYGTVGALTNALLNFDGAPTTTTTTTTTSTTTTTVVTTSTTTTTTSTTTSTTSTTLAGLAGPAIDIYQAGVAQSVGASTLKMAASESYDDGVLDNNNAVWIASATTGKGQVSCIRRNTKVDDMLTLVKPWVKIPTGTVVYVIIPSPNCNLALYPTAN